MSDDTRPETTPVALPADPRGGVVVITDGTAAHQDGPAVGVTSNITPDSDPSQEAPDAGA